MDIKGAEKKLNEIYDAAMEAKAYETALKALQLMPQEAGKPPQIRVVDCDKAGNITIDMGGLGFGKKPRKIKAINYIIKG